MADIEMTRKCSNCKYFDTDGEDAGEGHCFALPPQPLELDGELVYVRGALADADAPGCMLHRMTAH